MKQYRIQAHRYEPLPLSEEDKLPRVNYEELLDQLKFPVIWVYERYLQAWLPSEVDHSLLKKLEAGKTTSRDTENLKDCNLIDTERTYWETLQSSFASDGFVVLKQLLDENYAKNQLAPYYRRQKHLHERHRDLVGVSRTSINNLAWMRLIHQASEKLIRYVVSPQEIKTSYSFASEYDKKSSLPAHTDRPQCIYNISLMLGSSPHGADLTQWPLWISKNGKDNKIGLNPGDGVLYLGTHDRHWRDVMPDNLETVLGVFFHYVDSSFNGSLD